MLQKWLRWNCQLPNRRHWPIYAHHVVLPKQLWQARIALSSWYLWGAERQVQRYVLPAPHLVCKEVCVSRHLRNLVLLPRSYHSCKIYHKVIQIKGSKRSKHGAWGYFHKKSPFKTPIKNIMIKVFKIFLNLWSIFRLPLPLVRSVLEAYQARLLSPGTLEYIFIINQVHTQSGEICTGNKLSDS